MTYVTETAFLCGYAEEDCGRLSEMQRATAAKSFELIDLGTLPFKIIDLADIPHRKSLQIID